MPHKKKSQQVAKKNLSQELVKSLGLVADGGVTATISAVFTNTNPGGSKLTATFNNQSKSISSTGKISFSNVNSSDIILVQVNSLGISDITIDIPADPSSFHFLPGSHSGEFEIK